MKIYGTARLKSPKFYYAMTAQQGSNLKKVMVYKQDNTLQKTVDYDPLLTLLLGV